MRRRAGRRCGACRAACKAHTVYRTRATSGNDGIQDGLCGRSYTRRKSGTAAVEEGESLAVDVIPQKKVAEETR